MKKTYFIFLSVIVILAAFCSCSSNKNSDSTPSSATVYSSQNGENISLNNTTYNNDDVKKAEITCKNFLKEYQYKIFEQKSYNLDVYFGNDNLKNYSRFKIKNATFNNNQRIKSITNKMLESKKLNDYMFFRVQTVSEFESGGSVSEEHQFIVKKQSGDYLIFDWYTPGVGGSSALDDNRDYSSEINDPDIWNNDDFVNRMMSFVEE